MRKKKFIRALLILPFLVSFGFSQPDEFRHLSLQEALEIGAEQGYQLLIAKAQLSEAQGQNLEAWSGFLPRITVSENYVKSDNPVTVFGLKLKQGVFSEQDFAISSLNQPGDFENFTSDLTIKVPLLNLDAIFGKSAAGLIVKARKKSLERATEAIIFNIKTAYFGLILSYKSLAAIEDALKTAGTHRDNANTALEEGIVSQADYLATEVRLAELQEQRMIAQNQIQDISDGLKLILGLENETRPLLPVDSLAAPPELLPKTNLNYRLFDRADLRALHYQKQAAHRNLWRKRSAWLPRLNGFANWEWNASEVFRNESSNRTIGLQMSWHIFDGLAHWGGNKQAAARARQVEIQYRQARQQAENQVAAAQRKIQTARQRIRVAETAVRQARESLHIVEERFKEGLEKTADLQTKENMLTRAKLRLLKARHDYNLATSELAFALGGEQNVP